jgi:hypothetical protein
MALGRDSGLGRLIRARSRERSGGPCGRTGDGSEGGSAVYCEDGFGHSPRRVPVAEPIGLGALDEAEVGSTW